MRLDWQKMFAVLVAGICGITGFAITFWLLGLLFDPILAYFRNKGVSE